MSKESPTKQPLSEPGDRLGKPTFSPGEVTRLVPERFLPEMKAVLEWSLKHPDKIVPHHYQEPVTTSSGVLHSFHAKRLPHITYPHEWTPEMLRDAAILHCELLESAHRCGLFIKDPHPWNILFEGTTPLHVDLGSFVNAAALADEQYLHSNSQGSNPQPSQLLSRAFEMMLGPYFILPLLAHSQGRGATARKILFEYALNCSPRGPRIWDYLDMPIVKSLLKKPQRGLQHFNTIRRFRSLLETVVRDSDVARFAQDLKHLLQALQFPPPHSAYLSYYQDKAEWLPFNSHAGWQAKQHVVAEALSNAGINTVLDLGCNTGWYSELASHLGKQVLALDEDEDCLRNLYDRARTQKLAIVPIVSSLSNLPHARTSIHDGSILLRAPEERLVSDMVLALGLFHHLVLGRGLPTTEALNMLLKFARKGLVLEWVPLSDTRIVSEPSYFPYLSAAEKWRYELPTVLGHLRELGWHTIIKASYPSERSLIVCTRDV